MKKKILTVILLSVLCIGGMVVFNKATSNSQLKATELEKKQAPSNPTTKQQRADINDIWPGQTMMSDEYQLSDTGWESIPVKNSPESLVTFPISVEGFEDGTLIGHIRFGGVDKSSGKFLTDTTKQLRNLVFIVENTKQFKDKEKKVTIKYTYNYYQGTNSTYTMVPITNMAKPGMPHEIPNDSYYAFEVPQGGSAVTYRTVKELFIQEVGNTGMYAIQARTANGQGLGNLDFYFQQLKTLIPTVDGGVRIVNEVKNTGWRTGKENTFPRKTFGAMIGEDTMLNDIDEVPIFSLGSNKGVYIANNLDLFRVAFPRLQQNQGAADNYEGTVFNAVIGGAAPAFQKKPDGFGNEGQNLPLDTQVLPASGIIPPPKDPSKGPGYDTMFVQKWNPRQPPEVNEKAIMAYDVNVLPIYKPELKLDIESLNQSSHKDGALTFKGNWRDVDSLFVTLYYRIESQKSKGWVEFKKDSRQDLDDEKLKWFPFEVEIPANKFKLNGDQISFKAVDTTNVDSDEAITEVNTFETVTIKTEHYGPTGIKLDESSVPATPGKPYETTPNDYTGQGLTLDTTKTVGVPSGTVPNTDVLVKYYYKEGVVKVITHYLKEDNSELFPSKEVSYKYNQTYTTDDRSADAKKLDYYIDKITGAPTGSTGKKDTTIEVTYNYRIGKLGILEATEALEFGTHDLISLGTKDIYPSKNATLKILDELSGNWELELRISDNLTSGNTPLKGDLYFQTKEKGLVKLNGSGQSIHSRKDLKAGEIDLTWDRTKQEGLYVKQLAGNQKSNYEGKLEWNIVTGP